MHFRIIFLVCLALCLHSCRKPTDYAFEVPVEYYKLDNGLKVVLSQDASAPTVIVAVYYGIGFRLEPRGRTGFAHLFEHMMFQGSENLGKMEFVRLIQGNGGITQGNTRLDFTNFVDIVPAHRLETVLWAEADRMRSLDISPENLMNQKDVVKNEIWMNVLNQAYGGFPWLDMPQRANANWHNAHNFYGEFDQLEASTVDEVREFFRTYYRPGNAVLVVSGDFDPAAARTMVRTYFGDIPPARRVPTPDVSEPRQEGPKRFRKGDPLANRPALAFAYHMPERNSLEYYAMGLLDQILLQGDDAMLNDVLVRQKGLTGGIGGGINVELGNMFDCNGPMLWIASLYHDNDVLPDSIIAAVDSVIESLCVAKLDDAAVGRARIKFRSQFYDMTGAFFGMGRANLLGAFALFDDDPGKINEIEKHMRDITPAILQRTAAEYLRKTNQTVLIIVPAPAASPRAKQ